MALDPGPVALLERLVAVDTRNPGGDEPALAEVVADLLALHQPDDVKVVEVPREADGGARGAYVYARFGRPATLVNAHIDTVPPDAGWTADPFAPRTSDGRLTALGAADTKGAIAALVSALAEARPRNLALLFSGDEERGGSCMRAFLASSFARGLERAVVCEPTGCRVGVRHRGVLGMTAHLAGVGGHSSRADLLPAPVADLARLAVALDDWGKARRGEGPPGFPGMCVNVARLEGGVAFNVVPREATLSFSLRPPPGASVAAVRHEIEELCRRVVPAASIGLLLENPSFATRDLDAFRALLGETGEPVDLPFWTEAATLAQAGVDAVVYGPGDIEQAHAADEWVAVEQLERARATFVELFRAPPR